MSKQNRFQALSAAIRGEPEIQPEETRSPTVESTTPLESSATNQPPTKRGRAKGKRSDPNYEQVGAYIPKALYRDVKRLLLEDQQDFSDLVTNLLQEWVNQNNSVK